MTVTRKNAFELRLLVTVLIS